MAQVMRPAKGTAAGGKKPSGSKKAGLACPRGGMSKGGKY